MPVEVKVAGAVALFGLSAWFAWAAIVEWRPAWKRGRFQDFAVLKMVIFISLVAAFFGLHLVAEIRNSPHL
jgi:ABC-type uncharacterized transport system permease subunit